MMNHLPAVVRVLFAAWEFRQSIAALAADPAVLSPAHTLCDCPECEPLGLNVVLDRHRDFLETIIGSMEMQVVNHHELKAQWLLQRPQLWGLDAKETI